MSKRRSFLRRHRRWLVLAAAAWFSLPVVAYLALLLLGAMGGGMSRAN